MQRLFEKNAPSIQVPGESDRSTHLMADDGNGYVFPTVIRLDGKLQHLSEDDAYDWAKKTNTGIQMSKAQGTWFADNGYKTGTGVNNNIDTNGRPFNDKNFKLQQSPTTTNPTIPTFNVDQSKNSDVEKQQQAEVAQTKTNDKGSWSNIGSLTPDKILGGLGHDAASVVKGVGNFLSSDSDNHEVDAYLKPKLLQLGASLEGLASRHDAAAQNEALPNTATGNLTSGAIGFLPDVVELAGTPELKLGSAADVIAKYGGKYAPKIAEMAGGKFPTLMSTKGFLNGYNDAKANNETDTQAWGNSLTEAAKEWPKAAIFEAAGELGHGLTKSGIKAGEDAGLISDNKFVAGAEKRLVHSTAQGLAFSAVPVVTNALQGKGTSLDEIKQNGLFGAVLGGVIGDKGDEAKGQPTPADVAAQEIIKNRPQIDLNNFMNADMDAIKSAHQTESTPADLQMMSSLEADNAFKESDPDKKQQAIVQSSVLGKLSGVKSIVNSILSDKKGFIDGIQQSDMPDQQKQLLIQKAEDVTNVLHPDEIAKRQLSSKIQDIDNQLPQITEMVNQATDPLSKATAETALEKLTEERKDAETQLKGIIGNQMDNVNTPLPEIKSKPIEVDRSITPEERAQENAETDKKITDFQTKFPDHKIDPLSDLPDNVVRTFDRIDNDVPTDSVAVQEASDWLYKKYKDLTKMRQSDTRMLTTEQIDSYQNQLGKDITTLDEHAKKYHPDYEKPTEEIKPQESTIGEPNSSTEKVIKDNANPEVPEAELPSNTEENGVATSKTNLNDAEKEEGSQKESSQEKESGQKDHEEGLAESNVVNSGDEQSEPVNFKVGDPYKLANETGKIIRVKELDNGDTQLKVKKADDTSDTVVIPKKDKLTDNDTEKERAGTKKESTKKPQSLTDEEVARKKELRKKFMGTLNDITRIPTLLADKEFREYAGLVFKEATGDFKAFSKELIDSVGEKIKDHLQALFKELGGKLDDEEQPNDDTGTTGITKADVKAKETKGSGGEVKKTILTTRAYEGEIQDDVKEYLEKKGLTRQSFTQEERSKQATDFINKFGEDAAFQAVKSGDVDGGMAASILAQLQIRNSHEMAEWPIGTDERDVMAKKQANYIELAEKKGYLGGEFNGQLAYEYQNAELDYANVKKQVEKATGKPLTPEQEKNIKKITDENERLKNKLKEAESKLIDETDNALDGKDKPEKPVKPKTEYAKKALDAVVKVRAKIRANSYSDATGMIALVDTGLGVIETSIRAGITVSKAIEKGIEHIKTELKKRGIDTWEKEDDFRKDVTDAFEEEGVKDNKEETDAVKKQQSNIKRLEKELENAKQNRLKAKGTPRELSDEEKDLVDQINKEKLRIKLENLQSQFVDKTDNKFTASESRDIWDYMKQQYINQGVSYRDAISKVGDDIGLSWRQVSEAITTPKNKRISDEMWKRQADYTRNNTSIKDWVANQNKSTAGKMLQKASGLMRGISVFGHGGIFMGTHAGMTLFNPSTWNKTIPAFFNGWKLAYGKEANYQRAVEELKNSPNYTIAQRAGLKNNPERLNAEEYQRSQKYLGRLGIAGERGFNAVKILRQDLFDYHYNKLTPSERDDPATAESIAHLVNLATGATSVKIPAWVNEVAFAGGMEAARWEKLTASPLKATTTALNALINPSKVSTADKVFAKVWARRVGEQLATYSTLLAANAAIQNTINPKNKVNYTNPNAPDFMKFKFGDMTIDPTSGMRGVAMFMRTIGKIPFESKKDLHGDKRIAVLGKETAGYARGKLAPLYGTAADFFTSQDFSGNVMPYSSDKPAKSAHKLTWPEYAWSKTPLPIAEAAGVFYKSALQHGADKKTLDDVMKGIMSGAISGTTGFRVGEYNAADRKHK